MKACSPASPHSAMGALVHAHPLVIEETSKLPLPPGVEALWGDVALDGNESGGIQLLYPRRRYDTEINARRGEPRHEEYVLMIAE